ncbi:MAG: hypothetical protein ACI33I_10830 [Clostridium sp.]
MFIKENDKLKLKKLSLAGTGGQCLMSPPEFIDGNLYVENIDVLLLLELLYGSINTLVISPDMCITKLSIV